MRVRDSSPAHYYLTPTCEPALSMVRFLVQENNMNKHCFLFGFLFLVAALGFAADTILTTTPPTSLANAPVSTKLQDVRVISLANGLTVALVPMPGNPVLAMRYYVRAGSIFEGEQTGSGMSHFLEHLMGDGTTKRNDAQISEVIRLIGGSYNAYTTYSHCCYHLDTTTPHADLALELLTQNVFEMNMPPDQVEKERSIIAREINMNNDEPDSVLYYLFSRTANLVNPQRVPVIGYAELEGKLTREALLSYYHRFYVPNNTVLVIAGDMTADDMEKLVHKWCDPIPRGVLLPIVIPEEPRQDAPRTVIQKANYNLDYTMIGWHSQYMSHPSTPALDLASYIMGQGLSSRLYDELVTKRRLCVAVYASNYSPSIGAPIFDIYFTTRPGDYEKALAITKDIAYQMTKEPPTAEELSRAKRSMENSYIMSRDSAENLASEVGINIMTSGTYRYSDTYLERINALTPEDIRVALAEIVRPEGLTTVVLTSQPQTEIALGNKVASIPTMETRESGAKLIYRYMPNNGLVSVVVMTPAGSTGDPAGKEGLSNLAWRMMLEGAGNMDRKALADYFDRVGGINLATSDEYSYMTLTLRSTDITQTAGIINTMLTSPSIQTENLESLKAQYIESIKSIDDDWMGALQKRIRENFFTGSLFSRIVFGSVEGLTAIDATDVKSRLEGMCRSDGMVIAIMGDIDEKNAQLVADTITQNLKARGKVELLKTPMKYNKANLDLAYPGTQAVLAWMFPSFDVTNNDRYAMDVLDSHFSGYGLPSGPLHDRLRGAGLVYVTHAYNWDRTAGGYFLIYAATAPGMEERARSIVTEEIRKLSNDRISEEQLKIAQDMCLTGRALYEQQRPADLAIGLAYSELVGLGYRELDDYIESIKKVTVDDVQRVARKYLHDGATIFMHKQIAIPDGESGDQTN